MIPWRRKWKPTPILLTVDLMDRGAWRTTVHRVAKESDTTEQPNNSKTTNIYLQSLFFLIVWPFLKVFPIITISIFKNYGRWTVGFIGQDKNPSSSLTSLDFSSPEDFTLTLYRLSAQYSTHTPLTVPAIFSLYTWLHCSIDNMLLPFIFIILIIKI